MDNLIPFFFMIFFAPGHLLDPLRTNLVSFSMLNTFTTSGTTGSDEITTGSNNDDLVRTTTYPKSFIEVEMNFLYLNPGVMWISKKDFSENSIDSKNSNPSSFAEGPNDARNYLKNPKCIGMY